MRKVVPLSGDQTPQLLCPDLTPAFLAHENPWFKVLSRGSYYTIEYDTPQVVILPVLQNESVIMVRVKRPVIGDCPLELPAGGAQKGETPRMAAMREFAEETGVAISDPLRFVPDLPLSEMPGRMPVLLSIFRVDVRRQEFDGRKEHDSEVFSVEAVPLAEIARMILSGKIYLTSPAAILSRLLLSSYGEISRERSGK